jgi:2-polyprenyl-3-methyl-5-hydroxy-6-metoxy-1,4-benzoquinol methylase
MPDPIPDEIVEHYERDVDESRRLTNGLNELELVRTREIVERHLPPGQLRILDVGGGTGVHARWLAQAGHVVDLVDPMPRHVAAANALAAEGLTVHARSGDARALAEPGDTYDAVLLFGPLYHLIERAERVTAWSEALRVAKPGGLVFAAVISRFASLFSGLTHDALFDPVFRAIVEQDLTNGRHRNGGVPEYFTTAYFHHPDEVGAEATDAGAEVIELVGVEGLACWVRQLADRWEDPAAREAIVMSARAVESEPTLLGLGAHLLCVARKPG